MVENTIPGGAKGLWAPGCSTSPGHEEPECWYWDGFGGKPVQGGVDVSQHLSFTCDREGARGNRPGSEPDSGNPTVRDRKGGLRKRGHESRIEDHGESCGEATGP
jgi:hypothetical protein